jgi:hypothetical protein
LRFAAMHKGEPAEPRRSAFQPLRPAGVVNEVERPLIDKRSRISPPALRVRAWRRDRALIEEVRFAPDSLVEEFDVPSFEKLNDLGIWAGSRTA